MPAMLDDPTARLVSRRSGVPPFPALYGELPPEITPRQVTLRDRVTAATLMPFSSPDQVPPALLSYLGALLNREIEKGDTYPMLDPLPLETFGPYWFANFGAVMLLGEIKDREEVRQMELNGSDWEKQCLGSFYIKPNYPGRSSHVCNGGFLVTDAARNRGVGRLMGEIYLDWAPRLGYAYSVFNLVYETNVASLRIWDALGFKRIGRVKGAGALRSYPDELVDAIVYGRDLGPDSEEYVSEERFDKIRYYLKHGKYPDGADRAEKSRLRSAATHYKLIPETNEEPERLMLKGKEVISEPQKQYEIARKIHCEHHAGINKTTAVIAEKYHWVRIKETANQVIRNCHDCKTQVARAAAMRGETQLETPNTLGPKQGADDTTVLQDHADQLSPIIQANENQQYRAPMANMSRAQNYEMPVDPRIMEGIEHYDYHQSSPSTTQYQPQEKEQQASHSLSFDNGASSRPDLLYASNLEHHAPDEGSSSTSHHPLSADARIQQQLLDAGYGKHGHQ
ncbi:hypothetical protein EV356DRAFT_467960 [Viridothelium virens]|uniref:N-acetyltransferase domain-containing protein n=1 Tax=Viridothelium virens TaxID=1048519 RepID=A0A6A6H7T3_VIRVR|nr:hypothetical protein EV356DRAFT_467960 [Viridothelium virens]